MHAARCTSETAQCQARLVLREKHRRRRATFRLQLLSGALRVFGRSRMGLACGVVQPNPEHAWIL